jgi:class 3 adenylate cyclase
VHKSLVVKEEGGEVARYGLLEMIKQYAGEKLADRGETSDLADRHFRYYASFFEANDIHTHPLGPRSTAEEIERLECEYDNLLAALGRARSSADALRLSRVCGFWNATRRFHVARPLIERNLSAPDASPALRAGALTSLGWAAFVTDDIDRAATALEESLTLTRELGVDASHQFWVFRELSPLLDTIFALFLVRLWRADLDRLPPLAEEAMTIARRSGDTVELRVANIISGIAALYQLNIAAARDAFDEEIGLARSAGRPPSDFTLLILGQLDILAGDLDTAEARLTEGLEIATGPGTPLFFGPQLRGALAAVARHRGDIRGARAHLEAAVDSDDFFMPHQRMILLPQLTQVLVEDAEDASALDRIAERLDEFADSFPYAVGVFSATRALIEGRFADSDRFAREAFDHALPNFPESGDRPFSVWRDLQRSAVRAMRGDLDEADTAAMPDWVTKAPSARALWQAAQSTYLLESGDVDGARSVLEMLVRGPFVASLMDENRQAAICMMAGVAARLGDEGRAEVLYGYLRPNAGHLVASAGPAICVGAADRYLGMLAATMGRLDEAERHLEAALDLETALGANALVALTRLEYACVLEARGDHARASEMLEAALTTARELGMHKLERDALELLSSLTQLSPGEDRRVAKTFLFSDIVRSTNLIDAIGDEAWADLLTWHDEILRKLFVEHGGREVVHTGDGFFVTFEKADDALACAVAIQRSLVTHRRTHGFSPQVRIGLHASEAAEVRGNYHGRGVHEAARIGAAAEAGEILVSTSTLASIKAEMASAEERAVTLKGVAEPITVASVVWRND